MKKLLQSTLAAAAALLLAHGVNAGMHAEVGKPAPDFTLMDTQGSKHSLSDFAGKIVVLEWINDGCPYVKGHYGSGNMQALQKQYTVKDVVWLSICSSAPGQQGNHSAAEWEAIRQKQGHASTALLLDESGKVGKMYNARTTPHMYVIDDTGVLVYNGAIDSKAGDIKGATNYVAAALDSIMGGQPVEKSETKPYGCGVKYARDS